MQERLKTERCIFDNPKKTPCQGMVKDVLVQRAWEGGQDVPGNRVPMCESHEEWSNSEIGQARFRLDVAQLQVKEKKPKTLPKTNGHHKDNGSARLKGKFAYLTPQS